MKEGEFNLIQQLALEVMALEDVVDAQESLESLLARSIQMESSAVREVTTRLLVADGEHPQLGIRADLDRIQHRTMDGRDPVEDLRALVHRVKPMLPK